MYVTIIFILFRICAVDLLVGARSVAPHVVAPSARPAASKYAAILVRPRICNAIRIAAWVVEGPQPCPALPYPTIMIAR